MDLERTLAQPTPVTNRDPYKLSDGIISPERLRQWQSSNNKKAADYHHRQNELIGNLLKPIDELVEDARADLAENALTVGPLVHYFDAAQPGKKYPQHDSFRESRAIIGSLGESQGILRIYESSGISRPVPPSVFFLSVPNPIYSQGSPFSAGAR